jgi:hypothetical protein
MKQRLMKPVTLFYPLFAWRAKALDTSFPVSGLTFLQDNVRPAYRSRNVAEEVGLLVAFMSDKALPWFPVKTRAHPHGWDRDC